MLYYLVIWFIHTSVRLFFLDVRKGLAFFGYIMEPLFVLTPTRVAVLIVKDYLFFWFRVVSISALYSDI